MRAPPRIHAGDSFKAAGWRAFFFIPGALVSPSSSVPEWSSWLAGILIKREVMLSWMRNSAEQSRGPHVILPSSERSFQRVQCATCLCLCLGVLFQRSVSVVHLLSPMRCRLIAHAGPYFKPTHVKWQFVAIVRLSVLLGAWAKSSGGRWGAAACTWVWDITVRIAP